MGGLSGELHNLKFSVTAWPQGGDADPAGLSDTRLLRAPMGAEILAARRSSDFYVSK